MRTSEGGGIESSASTVGRIIGYLKRRGELVEPQTRSKAGKRRARRPYAIRKPRDWAVSEPGDLVQVDYPQCQTSARSCSQTVHSKGYNF